MPCLLMMMFMIVMVVMSVCLRTGGVFDPSTPGLAVVAAAILPQDHTPPQVARELVQLLVQRHGLVEIGQKLTKGLFRHV
jgi:hypothetical protein